MTARWPLAVVVSVAVHGALALGLLAVLGRAVAPAPKPAVEKATVVEVFRIGSLMPRAGKAAAEPPAPSKPISTPSATPRVAPQPAAPPGEGVQPAAPAVADQPVDQPTSSGSGEGDGPAASETAPAGTATGAGSGAGPTPADQGTAMDPSIAAEVHARLARAASDCYPAQARRFRQQGQVPVSFCVEGAGTASKVVVTASGVALLDEAARSCVMQRAEPFPSAAAGSCFSVKVEFGSAGVHVSR